MNLMLMIAVDEIDYVVEAEMLSDDYVDLHITRADGEDYEPDEDVLNMAMQAVGHVMLYGGEAETLH